jgi:hypothetical protein
MNLICTYTDISWYLDLTFSRRIWNHTHICCNNLHLLGWYWISLDEIVLWRWTVLDIYLDLKGNHWSLTLCSHCHQTIADFYHWWGLVNRQAYKVGESLNQIQLFYFLHSRKLQLENNQELLQFLHILCITFKIKAFFIIKLFTLLYVRVGILLKRGKQLNDRIISLRGKALDP